ncbi:hypothetical protein [Terriglobus albidus]|uniref:hypothetical protein n=1 Tax=Terriglobus albidus TaxID=1592106 RepID=UPI0021DF7066|nr:hypothetical protein [Terriglobus albidus]
MKIQTSTFQNEPDKKGNLYNERNPFIHNPSMRRSAKLYLNCPQQTDAPFGTVLAVELFPVSRTDSRAWDIPEPLHESGSILLFNEFFDRGNNVPSNQIDR